MIRARVLLPVGLALMGLRAHAADVAVVVADPTTSGSSRVQVVLEQPMAARITDPTKELRVAPGAGTGRVTKATPLATAGGGTRTFLVYDQSGSFKAHWSRAFELSEAFVGALPAGDHTVDVGTFGKTFTTHGTASDAAALRAVLKTAEGFGTTHPVTRLHALVKDAAEAVNRSLPLDRGGLRQVVVFTDLDEEGTFTAEDVIRTARGQGVRLHVVAFGGARVPAKRIDEAKRLAEATGGTWIDAEDPAKARAALVSAATAGSRTWWLEVGFCDVPTGRGQDFEDTLTAEVWDGSRVGVSAPFPFRQRAEPSTTAPCQAPVAPEPVVAAPSVVAPPEPVGLPPWLWGAAACVGLGLLGLLALPFLFAGRARGSDAPAPAPAPVEPARPQVPDGPPGGHRDADVFAPVAPSLLDRLPTTRLERVTGPPSAPASVPIDRARTSLGAGPGNDVVLQADTVSGRHAHLELMPSGDLWVTDDGSTNGTLVGGERLEAGVRRKLVHGDTLGFGKSLVYRVAQPELAGARPLDRPRPPDPPGPPAQKAPRERARTTFRPVKPPGGGSS